MAVDDLPLRPRSPRRRRRSGRHTHRDPTASLNAGTNSVALLTDAKRASPIRVGHGHRPAV